MQQVSALMQHRLKEGSAARRARPAAQPPRRLPVPQQRARPAAPNPGVEPRRSPDARGVKAPEGGSPSRSFSLVSLRKGSPASATRVSLSQDSGSWAETYQTDTAVKVTRGRQCPQQASPSAQNLRGENRRRGPRSPQPLSSLYCDWKPDRSQPLPSARSIPFKDKGSSMLTLSPSSREEVTF